MCGTAVIGDNKNTATAIGLRSGIPRRCCAHDVPRLRQARSACARLLVALTVPIKPILLLAKQTINLFYQFHQLIRILFNRRLRTQRLPKLQLLTFQFRLRWGMGHKIIARLLGSTVKDLYGEGPRGRDKTSEVKTTFESGLRVTGEA